MTAGRKFKHGMTISNFLSQGQLETIFQRAYELYEARGRKAGYELEDWRQAEAEIISAYDAHGHAMSPGQHRALAKNAHDCRRSEVEDEITRTSTASFVLPPTR